MVGKTRQDAVIAEVYSSSRKSWNVSLPHGLVIDEPQFWYNSGSFWPTLLAQTIHLYLLMHAFLSYFVLFVGGRLDTLST